ncbi:hypothetical protein BEN47_07255 [Hymenobacter lapidarius]|uniref:Lipocalin-like domain-containing protein n=1 Tax=Hymenobacter lapidarius TaxID=1908237 RepID=A0A1G1TEX6_9BACT|nr:hypothetical protein [Hymenobacter lapidarius]OGX89427.1 hypothetical protein BEN47_07255 [Hymenobacter lapidarius]
MRYLLISALPFLLLTTSCKKSTPIPNLDGTYSGTFQREPGGQISQVSLVFSGGEWSGTSQIPKYPALCSGTYKVTSNDKITFTNACIWTAEFDWTLILGGEYDLNTKGNTIEIIAQKRNERDIYRLSKK